MHGKNKPSYVFIDEAQKVSPLFNAVQFLIDMEKAQFVEKRKYSKI